MLSVFRLILFALRLALFSGSLYRGMCRNCALAGC
jgi:hypothetical protein